ncbi:folylpolyglutamate synthase [Tilletia horrida]|nr:folylpolyglutamate synthase [Tilletia horrida]
MVATGAAAAAIHGSSSSGSGSGSGGNGASGSGAGARSNGGGGGGGGGAQRGLAASDQPFIMLVSKSPLPPFCIPYPQPPPETPIAELRRAVLDIYVPSKHDQLAVTYAEQLRLSTLTSWRLGMLVLHLHQNALIDPATRESAVQQVGYRLEDDHECSLIEDGDEIHITLKEGYALSELQLPKLGPNHIYAAPANVVSLTRKGTLSQPPPYSLLAPAEPSSHSSSVAGQPTANYHSHAYTTDWRSPFRVVTAPNIGSGVVRRELHGANAAVSSKPGPATTGSVLRHMPRQSSSGTNPGKKASRRATHNHSANGGGPTAGASGTTAAPELRTYVTQSRISGVTGDAQPPPGYASGHELLNLPPTARVIGSGVQGTAGNGRKRSGSRQNSSSSGGALGNSAAAAGGTSNGLIPIIPNTSLGGAGLTVAPRGEAVLAEPETYVLRVREATRPEDDRPREPSAPSRNANGAGVRRSSAASREAKAVLNAPVGPRPGFPKHSGSGYQSYTSSASQAKSPSASATAAFLNSPTSVSTPPIVNLSPFPESSPSGQGASPASTKPSSAEVSAAMLQHLRRARSSFVGGQAIEAAETGDSSAVGTPAVALDDASDNTPTGEDSDDEAEGEGSRATSRGKSLTTRRKSKGKNKAASSPLDREAIEASAQRADKRYREVRATLEREIAKQAAADGARAAQIAEEHARRDEERRKREEEERKQAVREKWELWEEVKKREKREMKDRKRRGEEVPAEAMLGPTGAEV